MALTLKDRLARQAAGNTALSFDPTGGDEPQLVAVPIRLIDPDPKQPRKDLGDLTDLAMSIREHGLLQPLIVEAVDGGRYRILAGERRFAACRSLGMETVPSIVRTVAEQSRLVLQLIENLQRKDLHPVEVAQAYQRLMSEFNLTQRDLARRVGKSLTTVNESLRILEVPPDVLADVRTSEHGSKSVLIEIAKAPEPETQRALWQQAKDGHLTARDTRDAKRKAKGKLPRKPAISISLPDATVTVRFKQGDATQERVRTALDQALAGQR